MEPTPRTDPPARGSRRGRRLAWIAAAAAVGGALWAMAAIAGRGSGPDGPTSDTAAEPAPLVDPNEIVSGGPPPDGIPPIDDPTLEPVASVDWLAEREPVIALEIEEDARAYPLQVLTWHEIVNDRVGGVDVAVTFCPLCNTPVVFERPVVDGEVTTFGTSGKLYHSNLVMYDRATNSYWPQALGQAVTGPLTGTRLELVPAQIVAWDDFRRAFPDGQVLSRDTGFDRPYGQNPYPGYDNVDRPPFLFRGQVDGRLAAVERVLGVRVGGEVVAFPYFRLERAARGGLAAVNTEVGGEPVVVVWKAGAVSALDARVIAASREVGAAAAFSREVDGRVLTLGVEGGALVDRDTGSTWDFFGRSVDGPLSGRRLPGVEAIDSFWFDWAAFHPDTEIWVE